MSHEIRRPTIMFAEPDRTVLEMLQIRFDVAGYNSIMARNGQMTVETLRTFRPAALAIEMALPDMTALDVLRTLYPAGERPPFPVLLMGRQLAAENVQAAAGLGVRGCMAKPFGGADVLDRVERMLRKPTASPSQRSVIVLNDLCA